MARLIPLALVFTSAPAAESDPTTDDPCAAVVTYRVPGSRDDMTSKAIVVVPQEYRQSGSSADATGQPAPRYPVVYLLHGYSGSYRRWYEMMRDAGKPLQMFADRHHLIIVCPDGQPDSWYLDVPADMPGAADCQCETAITLHLVPEIDRRYRTWAEPAGRGITGASMGGHGALYLAARHPEMFSVCTGLSGVMDLTNTTQQEALGRRLGPLGTHHDRWIAHSVLTQAERFAGRSTGIMIDCGRQDVFFADHQALHRRLVDLDVRHDYVERPGAHQTAYWTNALAYHMQFLADRLKPAGVTVSTSAPAIER